ncbi:MAG: hypothetical protein M5U19_20130 [Microthrixaceae bacterium]|nr:hypothetical protein [Microthrixaceae bacterium]
MSSSAETTRVASSRKGLVVIGLVAALAFLGASCGANTQPTGYGDDYKDNFMLGCTGVDTDGQSPEGYEKLASEKQCTCVYDGLEEKVPFEEAKEFEEAQAEADSGAEIDVPDNIAKIFEDCGMS